MTDRVRLLRAVVFAALCVALAAAAHVAMGGAGVTAPVLAGAAGAVLLPTWLLAGKRRGLAVISVWMVVAQSALHLLFQRAGSSGSGGSGGGGGGTDWAALLLCNPDRLPGGLSPVELARMAGLDPGVAPPASVAPHGAAGMHHAMAGMPGLSGMPGMSGMRHGMSSAHGLSGGPSGGMAHGMSAGMLAAHVVAALACALLLWRGDAALVRLFELFGALGAVVAGAVVLPLLALRLRPFGYRPPTAPRPADRSVRPARSVLLTHAVVRRGPPALALAC
ncbi:hypothetical protein [Streptomyces sp. NRRL WC-3742]|uniref:hypothetical protein n=1 Tax=Streptomyces sp. NRRL WC-3742 TaxID=1463934 RepID=UPI00131C59F8|nr:hypothetical protein [Streptomyces sp. NRRL WC-3742]